MAYQSRWDYIPKRQISNFCEHHILSLIKKEKAVKKMITLANSPWDFLEKGYKCTEMDGIYAITIVVHHLTK